MKKILLFIVCLGLLSMGFSQPGRWQQEIDYSIDVTLNDTLHTLDGFVTIKYHNQSPDTLFNIWFHLPANAFKNDRTALSRQMLQNNDTRFYFSSPGQKGYINQLDFRINNLRLSTEAHPDHIDIVNILLPGPLLPGGETVITTPFHVQLPEFFSGNGHKGQSYQVAAWYPQPAVYDHQGWHPMPYLNRHDLYSERSNFDVTITIPENYVVTANGALQTEHEKQWLNTRSAFNWKARQYRKKTRRGHYKIILEDFPPSAAVTKTIRFREENSTKFTWFADKRYVVNHDTCALASGQIIELYSAYTSTAQKQWNNSIAYMKKAVRYFSRTLGNYPFATLSIAEGPAGTVGNNRKFKWDELAWIFSDSASTERFITHAVAEIWTNCILSPNTRIHPWMDKGFTTFYSYKIVPDQKRPLNFNSLAQLALESVTAVKKDQPIETPAPAFSAVNYYLSAGQSAAKWIQLLKNDLGETMFDSCMQAYSNQWQFKHPYPEDFKHTLEQVSGKHLDNTFLLLNTRGSLLPPVKKKTKLTWLGKPNGKYQHAGIAPALGFNQYDKLMAGAVIHNYSIPFTRFRFIAVPLYATGTKKFNGIGRVTYSWYPGNTFDRIETGLSIATFTEDRFKEEVNPATFLRYLKFSPQIRLSFANPNLLSRISRFVQLKTPVIKTNSLQFTWDSVLMKNLVKVSSNTNAFMQLRFVTENNRALYPYHYSLLFELSEDFGKICYTGNYLFNYAKGGGVNLRWFAGKFFYLGGKTIHKQFETDPYHLNMSAPRGYEDYTYDNYFLGRSAFSGFASQQVMMRDGGFKARTDLLSNKAGKTDNWLAALNFTTTIHPAIPVKLFLDLGTYHREQDDKSSQPALLYDGGLQLSFCKDIINVYIPLVYSKVYRDYYRSTPGNGFWQRISFSIDIQDISFRKINPLIPF